jgi:hypothetical protein
MKASSDSNMKIKANLVIQFRSARISRYVFLFLQKRKKVRNESRLLPHAANVVT